MNILYLCYSLRTLRMETSVKAAEVLVPPQPDVSEDAAEEAAAPPAACSSPSDFIDPMLEFSRRLEDIISTYGSAASVLDRLVGQMTSNGFTH